MLLLVTVGVVAAETDSAASVAPDWSSSSAMTDAAFAVEPAAGHDPGFALDPAAGRDLGFAPDPVGDPVRDAAVGWGAGGSATLEPRGRWSWPLQPPPPVITRFAPPEVRWGSGHRGVDLGATPGQDVVAPTDGVVAFRGVVVDRAVLVIAAAGGLRITFEPVESELPVGTTVRTGQVVGTVSARPGHCAPATCVHWGVLRGERYLDPLSFVTAVRVVLLPLHPP